MDQFSPISTFRLLPFGSHSFPGASFNYLMGGFNDSTPSSSHSSTFFVLRDYFFYPFCGLLFLQITIIPNHHIRIKAPLAGWEGKRRNEISFRNLFLNKKQFCGFSTEITERKNGRFYPIASSHESINFNSTSTPLSLVLSPHWNRPKLNPGISRSGLQSTSLLMEGA